MIFAYSIFPRYNVQLLTSKRPSHNTYDLKKSSTAINTNLRGGEWKTSRFDRTIDGRSNALHQLPLKKQRVYSRATHEQTFPLQVGVSGVITVHVSFHDSGLATRVYSSFLLPLLLLLPLLHLSLSLSRAYRRARPRGWKYKGVVAGAPNFRVRSLSRRRRSGERGKRNEAKGWLCSSCKRGREEGRK